MRTLPGALASRLVPLALLLSDLACSPAAAVAPEAPPPAVAPAAPAAAAAPPAATTLPAAPTPPAASFKDASAYVQGLIDQKHIAGAVVLAARDGKVELFESLGQRDVEANAPMMKDTIFRICSMSKPVTAVGVLTLIDEGKVALTDPISKFIPGAKGLKALAAEATPGAAPKPVKLEREVTIEDLLTHTAGFTYGFLANDAVHKLYRDAQVWDGLAEAPGTMGDNVQRLFKLPLVHQPGQAWTYGLSFDVLGYIIEVVSKKTLAQFLEERIFAPLKMVDTGFRVPPEKEPRLAAVYQPKADKTIERMPKGLLKSGKAAYSATFPLDRASKYFSGGAGLVSTASDFLRFAQMLQNGGELDGARILKKETLEMMTQNRLKVTMPWSAPGSGSGYGLGVAVATPADKDRLPASAGTYSWGGAYNTFFWVDPKTKVIGLVLAQLYPFDHLSLWTEYQRRVYAAVDAGRK